MSGSDQLTREWRAAGIERGDVVLLHSSIKRTLRRVRDLGETPSAELVLGSFLDALGSQGTLLLPLFNFDFASGVPFDLRTTPSQMGALTEAGRKHPSAVRTGHPIYSFAVIGAQANRFKGCTNFSGYGSDSPFAILREIDGKIAVLDLTDQNGMTFYHHVEEMNQVSNRFHKVFRGEYVDDHGVTTHREFGLFVRDLERGVETDVDAMGERLWQARLYSGERPGQGSGLRVIRARPLFEATSAVIREGKDEGLLCRIGRSA